MSLSEVSNILWRERRLLELLAFKLEEEQMVVASGRTRWLPDASREVETIVDEIKRAELERAMAITSATRPGGYDTSSLRELSLLAPAPWDAIFTEHRCALLLLVQEIRSITDCNRDLLPSGRRGSYDACFTLGDVDPDFDDASPAPPRSGLLRSLDEAI